MRIRPKRCDSEAAAPAYKDVTLRQLRSFCETARSGSMTRAAKDLRLSNPTVWKQVHALEAQFGVRLISPGATGSVLTDEGRALAELASPLVTDIDRLKDQFASVRARLRNRLTVAASVRFLVEALPTCVEAFVRARPGVLVRLRHADDEYVAAAVESGDADLGLTGKYVSDSARSLLACRLCYSADVILVAPRGHELLGKRTLVLEDLRRFPLVNGPGSFGDPAVNLRLERAEAFQHAARQVEAFAGMTVMRYVERGFGIGLVPAVPGLAPPGGLGFRSLKDILGEIPVYLVTRKHPKRPEMVSAFAEIVSRTFDRALLRSHRR